MELVDKLGQTTTIEFTQRAARHEARRLAVPLRAARRRGRDRRRRRPLTRSRRAPVPGTHAPCSNSGIADSGSPPASGWWRSSSWGSLQTTVGGPTSQGFDKVEHFATYLFLAAWFTGLVPRARWWRVVAGLLGLGLAMELGQYLMQAGRMADPPDMLANTAGIAAGHAAGVRSAPAAGRRRSRNAMAIAAQR